MAGEGALAAADGEARQAPAARRSREARQAPAARRSRMPAKGSCGRCFFGGGLWADRLRSRPRPRAPDRRHGPPGRCRGFLGLGFCLAFLFHALQVIEPAAGRACSSPCQASPLRAPVFLHGFGVSISRSASAPRASLRLRALLGLWLHDLSEHKRTADTHVGAQLERSTCE